ncbi:hypothetical protein EGH82_18530 [Vibrio ponticus]|uniref:Lipoprotein n=1 Tax=Vibrio ponticus TaxID=265668 RepID=A0A3N3DVL6_9VIBR|nr:DUF6279 family lipoprotein [Vibrio ponticus]ROV58409.1 hypothetical protein EGH82_18530 [Vibrio ponticus]
MRRWLLILLCSLGLVGCGTKLVYDNLDWFAIQYVEDFVDLDNSQQTMLRQSIQAATPWHRSQEIPIYINHLDQLLKINPSQLTVADLVEQQETFRQHSLRLVEHFLPAITNIVSDMSDEQVEQLMDEIRVRHVKYKKKYQSNSEQELRKLYRQRVEENLQNWLGDLTQEQQVLVEAWSQQWLVTTPFWVEYQTQIRVELSKMFAERRNPEQLQALMRELLFRPQQYYPPQLAARIDLNTQIGQRYFVQIINLMTRKQTRNVKSELEDWREIAMDLTL